MLEWPPIDRDSQVPPYRQIAGELIARIGRGEYRAGQRLPGIYDLVGATGVNRSTALKALQLLAEDGYAELSVGLGYFVVERDHHGTGRPRTASDDTK